MRKAAILAGCLLVALSGCQAWAITGLGIGVRGGMIQGYRNDNLDEIPTLEKDWLKEMPMVGVHLKIGTLRVVHLEASLEYAWKDQDIVLEQAGKAEFSLSDLSLNGTAKYMFSFPGVKPYAGAGLGIHRLVYGISNEAYSIYIPDDENKLGFHLAGGLLLSPAAFPLEIMVEARYTSVRTAGKSSRYATLLAGLTYKLP